MMIYFQVFKRKQLAILSLNNPSFDYLDFVLLGFSSKMVSEIVNSGTGETSNYRNKMKNSFDKTNTQYRKRYHSATMIVVTNRILVTSLSIL